MIRKMNFLVLPLLLFAASAILSPPSPWTVEAASPPELVQQARNAFEAAITINFGPGQPAAGFFQIPAGKRMVVDTVTGTIVLFNQSVDSLDRVVFQNFLDSMNDGFENSDVRFHHLQLASPRQVGANLIYTISQATRFYADPGITFPAIQIGNVVGVPAGEARFTISGYLVPNP